MTTEQGTKEASKTVGKALRSLEEAELEKLLGKDVSLEQFLTTSLPTLIERFGQVEELSEIEPIVSLYLTDLKKRYTLKFNHDRTLEVVEGDMIDFPLATCFIDSSAWHTARPLFYAHVQDWIDRVETLTKEFTLTTKMAKKYERVDGTISFLVHTQDTDLTGEIILNDYEKSGRGKSCRLETDVTTLHGFLAGDEIATLVSRLKISGNIGLAATLTAILVETKR